MSKRRMGGSETSKKDGEGNKRTVRVIKKADTTAKRESITGTYSSRGFEPLPGRDTGAALIYRCPVGGCREVRRYPRRPLVVPQCPVHRRAMTLEA